MGELLLLRPRWIPLMRDPSALRVSRARCKVRTRIHGKKQCCDESMGCEPWTSVPAPPWPGCKHPAQLLAAGCHLWATFVADKVLLYVCIKHDFPVSTGSKPRHSRCSSRDSIARHIAENEPNARRIEDPDRCIVIPVPSPARKWCALGLGNCVCHGRGAKNPRIAFCNGVP